MIDLSATGVRVRALAMLDEGTQLKATLDAGGRAIAIEAVVIWTTPTDFARRVPGELGLQLLDPSAEYLALVAESFSERD